MKKIYLSKTNRKWLGVLGGVGEFFEVDPTALRLLWLLVVVFTGFLPGLIVYIGAYFVMPEPENPGGRQAHEAPHKKESGK